MRAFKNSCNKHSTKGDKSGKAYEKNNMYGMHGCCNMFLFRGLFFRAK